MGSDLFLCAKEEILKQRPVVLLTIIHSSGSAPREAGTHALMLSDGTVIGTVGGGAVEAKAFETARYAFLYKMSKVLVFDLRQTEAPAGGAVCGGEVRIFCQYLNPHIAGIAEWIFLAVKARKEHLPYMMVIVPKEDNDWGMAVLSARKKILCVCGSERACADIRSLAARRSNIPDRTRPVWKDCGQLFYAELLARPGRVFIFGAGHVAQALVPVLTGLDFPCVVVDDRSEFANAENFPQAEEIFVGNMKQLHQFLIIKEYDYVCIMTRGHVSDYEVERQILPSNPGYIGVIGSKEKLKYVYGKLLKDGFTEEELSAVHAPIGVPISAQTPAEIAVSIAAELIAVRARRDGREKENARKWRSADVPSLRVPE